MSRHPSELSPEELETVLWKRGVKLLDAGNADAALDYLLHLHSMQPDNAECLNKLGVAYAKLEALDRAERAFSRVLEIQPRFAPAHSNLGNIHYSRREYEEAATRYRQALAISPDYHVAKRNLAAALRRQGKYSEAIACMKAADRLQRKEWSEKDPVRPDDGKKPRRFGCMALALLLVLVASVLAVVAA